jgi:hypothetical protein
MIGMYATGNGKPVTIRLLLHGLRWPDTKKEGAAYGKY